MARTRKYLDLVGKLEKLLSLMEEDAMLPPEQQLAEEFDVSKPTLRRALQVLADQGRIRKINGVGAVVVRPPRTLSRELIFVCHDIVFFAESLKSFASRARQSNYFISIVPLSGDEQDQERILSSAAERRPAGMAIYADPRRNDLPIFHRLAADKIPSLYLIRLPRGIDNNLLEFGNADGMSEIVEAFYGQGCRKIALYGDEQVNPSAVVEREQGFLAGMKRSRLKPRPEYWCPPEATPEQREEFLQLLGDEEKRPDAVCALNDHCAGRLLKTLQNRGVDPTAIRFSGFDHSPLSEFLPQPLLTVAPPMVELGQVAAEMLVRQVENPQFGFQRRKLRAALVDIK
jgi:DNA-binding LacI/PurR family transcriptional regulator